LLIGMYGTTAGEVYRTADALQTTQKYTIPSGRPVIKIFCLNPGPSTFDWWGIADDIGNVYVLVHRVENDDYALALYYSDGQAVVSGTTLMEGTVTATGETFFEPLTEMILVGGDSSAPDTMVRRAHGNLNEQRSVGGTFGWAIGEPTRPSPIPAFTGAIRDAITAAGPGHTAQAVAGFLFFSGPWLSGQTSNDTSNRSAVIFTDGVDPRVWFHDGTAWQPATGITGG